MMLLRGACREIYNAMLYHGAVFYFMVGRNEETNNCVAQLDGETTM